MIMIILLSVSAGFILTWLTSRALRAYFNTEIYRFSIVHIASEYWTVGYTITKTRWSDYKSSIQLDISGDDDILREFLRIELKKWGYKDILYKMVCDGYVDENAAKVHITKSLMESYCELLDIQLSMISRKYYHSDGRKKNSMIPEIIET